ncbi:MULTISPECIES: putative phage tail protein [unclassified Polaromonas]|jgi:uncharacterized protein YmfQ (DUF2313 family)|uniref:putative phage tail protein n=1 Tax=unclassified Polaromonas TaxID=2638319 RepID=UPI000BC3D44D|nr:MULTISPECIES: putative phage tail protein [unclassified Polaromonas]OYY34575.1 MAG: hypothetical protein B7Y60_15970 [Polaromonas sp. 35-63-35]OYZ15064.1 MAG: hypothetical protein B7Y28_22610 [Polaromonas sp. 16-63-31]OYZ78865.1 MAG: hypothetical protein B7Y09_11320 [Polaromonas sp. 24-63-21]OZA49621.1 MAG: hypothetical protein B7X88_14510 [Polaromonas sp. 17-63-33]OZA86835.1 MAG: hypothetical protein B7X65_15310 [Polaromonas sp. 39-63-25]
MNTRDALIACLPPLAYDRQAPGVQAEATAAAAILDDAITSADVVRLEHQPEMASVALVDWERNYNLPDDCVGGLGASIDARRKSLSGRIYGRGNLSRPFLIEQAADLGYPGCTITELGPMSCTDPCDSPVNGEDFIGVWRLNVPVSTAIRTATCTDPCDSQLRSWGNTQLECVINRRKPAHTVAIFGYAP